eukprot:1954416-Pyramimonas_sp.AAC.1
MHVAHTTSALSMACCASLCSRKRASAALPPSLSATMRAMSGCAPTAASREPCPQQTIQNK